MYTSIGSSNSATPAHSSPITERREPDGTVGNHGARSLSPVDIPQTVPELPNLAILSIAKHLPFETLPVLSRTCKRYHALINDSTTLMPKNWFAHFSTQRQQQLKNNVKCKTVQELKTWVSQFTPNRRIAEELVEKCHDARFPEHLLFTVSKMMAKCPTFELREIASIPHDEMIMFAIFSPDSKHVLTASHDNIAKIFSRSPDGDWTPDVLVNFNGHSADSGEFSPDGRWCVIVASLNHTVSVLARNAGGHWQHGQVIPHSGPVARAMFSPDSRYLLTTDFQDIKIHVVGAKGDWVKEANIRLHDTFPEPLEGFKLDFYQLNPVFSPCGNRFIVRGRHAATVYARQGDGSWEQEPVINHHDDFIYATFSPNGNELITVIWEETKQVHFYARNPEGSWVKQQAISYDRHFFTRNADLPPEISPNGNYIMMNNRSLCNIAGAAIIHGRRPDGSWQEECCIQHNGRIHSATFSSDSNHVVTTGGDKTAKIYRRDPAGHWQRVVVIDHDDWVMSACFSPDDNFVITNSLLGNNSTQNNTTKIHGRTDGQRWAHKATFSQPCDHLFSPVFSPDGSHALTLSEFKITQKAIIWSIQRGERDDDSSPSQS